MQDINTLVIFGSRTGVTEKVALAAALGAVQAKSNIRLRWLREDLDDQTVDGIPGCRENRIRMTREYIAPREIDLLWADALVIGMPAHGGGSSAELKACLATLGALHAAGKLGGKVGTAFSSELVSLCDVLDGLGLIVVDVTLIPPDAATAGSPVDGARLHGQKVTRAARDLKR